MRKFLSVVLMLCLVMAIAATAVAEKVVYQDDVAPELMALGDAAALIRDAQGNVLAVIPSEELIKRICVGERDSESDAELAALLEKGLFSLMDDKHLANAPWLVDTDLFYVQIPAEFQQYFAEGSAQMDMKFNPTILEKNDKLTVLYSKDGENWSEITGVSFEGNGTVRFGVKESGLLTFVIEHGAAFPETVGGEVEETEEVEEETNPNFTPSVSGKPEPDMVPFEENGEEYAAKILDDADNTVAAVPAAKWIVVTPMSERKYNPDVLTYEHLKWAYEAIRDAQSIGDLPTDGEEGALGAAIDSLLQAQGIDLTHEELTVSDLIEISVYGEYRQYLAEDTGNTLEITFDKELDPNDTLVVLCASGIDSWHVIDAKNVIINANGTVTLRMKHAGVVAFLVERAEEPIEANEAGVVTAP